MTNSPNLPADGIQALNDLVAESRALREGIDTDRQLWKIRIRMGLALVVVAVVMIGGLLTIVVQNRLRSNQNSEILRRNAELSELIADCTTTGGECYERGQRRTGGAVAEVARLQILIELCGQDRGNDTEAELQRCVAARTKGP
jgi:hypothetical protein